MLMRGKRERAQKRIRFSNAEKNSSKTNLNLSDPNIIFEPKKVFQNWEPNVGGGGKKPYDFVHNVRYSLNKANRRLEKSNERK